MPITVGQRSLFDLLSSMRTEQDLKRAFLQELNYDPANDELPTRDWPEGLRSLIATTPKLVAKGGLGGLFGVIYTQLADADLSLSAERQLIEKLLQNNPTALFVFSNQDDNRWHLVNVKNEAPGQARRIFRRMSVGEGERVRTAWERLQLVDLEAIAQEIGRPAAQITALDIQARYDEAFDVAVVTKAFFEKYADVFGRVEASIQGLEGPALRLFTQKLFNRLMFIAFIQKKGWLRLGGRTDYLAALWDAHRRDTERDKNFYRDRLQLLFFAGLNNPQEQDLMSVNQGGFLRERIGEVPYLNGGLFDQEPDDSTPDLFVPDDALGAILNDLFDGFNFTITESTPLDVEVAVDPEMLGRVFEELVTGRHESGSYYTPKPIVSFMCREALKGYLGTHVPTESAEAVAALVDEHNPSALRNPEAVLEALRRVRVVDPACGSGAYLLGMLHELLDLRDDLFRVHRLDARSVYLRKLEIIRNNIYGVDLDQFAVNIARLRLWLSLAVDGDEPTPLPNLDFKIEQGDSLTALNPELVGGQGFRGELIRQFREAKASYMTSHGGDKRRLKDEAESLKGMINEWTHSGKNAPPVAGFDWAVEFAELWDPDSKGDALADGFDIVVANPPYVRQELIKELKPVLKNVYPEVYTGVADLYVYFYARALQLLRPGGMLAFISSNKWFRATYGANLRKYVAETCSVRSITDFGDLPVFEGATAYPIIFIAQKGALNKDDHPTPTMFTRVTSLDPPYPDVLEVVRQEGFKLPLDALNGAEWNLTTGSSASRRQSMTAAGIPLGDYVKGQIFYGLKTGFNTAFVIDSAKRAELIRKDPKSAEIIKPLAVGKDIRRWHVDLKDRWLIYSPWSLNIDEYPAVKAHLSQWRVDLEARPECRQGRYKWWCMARYGADYYWAFDKPKIIYPQIMSSPSFAYDTTSLRTNQKCFIITNVDYYLLGILNSSSIWKLIADGSPELRGGFAEPRKELILTLPVPTGSIVDRNTIADLVQKCLDAKGVGCEEWEREINERVARLYGLEGDVE